MRHVDDKPGMLIVTPALVGGSWSVIKELIIQLNETYSPIIIGLGPRMQQTRLWKEYSLPWLDYEEFGPRLVNSLLGILWFEVPLALASLLLWIRFRPKLWMGNGLLSAAIGIVPEKITGGHVVVSYNSYMGGAKGYLVKLAAFAARNATLILANSEGSKADLAKFASVAKIRVLPLTAEDVFFADGDPARLRKRLSLQNRFVVLFVGRLDAEKHCDFLLDVAELIGVEPVTFVFVGHGALTERLRRLASSSRNIIHAGRVTDRQDLRDYYQMADVVWSYADETYLAKPAVEALASGTPIIVPRVPALLLRVSDNATVDPKLVPPTIGWIVGLGDPSEAADLITELASHPETISAMRDGCRRHARERYSSEVLKETAETFSSWATAIRGPPLPRGGE